MVKPGGTGKPRLAISARLAPLPPSRSRISDLPSALPLPKVNTHLPAGTAAVAGFFTAGLAAGFAAGFTADFGTGLAALFFSALRAAAGGAAFFRAGTDAFDFAAVFFVFATALAMTYKLSAERGMDWAPYTILNGSAQGAMLGSGAYRCNQRNSPRPIRPLRIKKIAT